ncbi:MAG: TIGR02587 family membrane protein [Xanthomonadaceae bacterium]|nr:TIGR02587 family membrane protein [Xanthomonadaceae bacterium]
MGNAFRITDVDANRAYAIGVARAFGGALLFSLPILMTMETWQLGFMMDRHRLVVLMLALLPVLVGLAYYSGFEDTTHFGDSVLDAFVAIAVTSFMATIVLLIFRVIKTEARPNEWIGMIALQAVPGSIGALLAQSQFGHRQSAQRKRRISGDFGEYFLMCAGALFLAANIAPTEEVLIIALQMSPWQSIVLAALSLALMHTFVYAAGFRGQHERPQNRSFAAVFVKFSVNGYVLALAISAFICWTFGRFEGLTLRDTMQIIVVLGFPASVGAASARLVL